MSDEMIERARRIVAGEFVPENVKTSKRRWAEALLAERAKREEAERERDAEQEAGLDLAGQLVAAEARVATLEATLREVLDYLRLFVSPELDTYAAAAFARFDAVLAGGSDES